MNFERKQSQDGPLKLQSNNKPVILNSHELFLPLESSALSIDKRGPRWRLKKPDAYLEPDRPLDYFHTERIDEGYDVILHGKLELACLRVDLHYWLEDSNRSALAQMTEPGLHQVGAQSTVSHGSHDLPRVSVISDDRIEMMWTERLLHAEPLLLAQFVTLLGANHFFDLFSIGAVLEDDHLVFIELCADLVSIEGVRQACFGFVELSEKLRVVAMEPCLEVLFPVMPDTGTTVLAVTGHV